MGMVIVHQGQIVFETYPRMQPYEKPIWWSVTKVLVSTVVAILEDRGLVDVQKPIEIYVPELEGSDFAGVSVRNILDMASGVDCPDGDYTDRESCYYKFEASLGDAVRDESTPDNPYDMLKNLNVGRWAEPGTGFDYSGTNTFVLSWLVEKITGMPFQDALTAEIWSRMGAEADASIYAGRYGIPLTSGGLLAKPRDMARFGLLFTPSYKVVSDERIVSERVVKILTEGGRPELLHNARFGGGRVPPDVKHNVYQWDRVFVNNDLYKGGWAGQGLLVNPDRDLVAVWVGYSKDDSSSEMAPLQPLRKMLETLFGE
jgi:CubicO group peptidase (beta-lactamase class C family)